MDKCRSLAASEADVDVDAVVDSIATIPSNVLHDDVETSMSVASVATSAVVTSAAAAPVVTTASASASVSAAAAVVVSTSTATAVTTRDVSICNEVMESIVCTVFPEDTLWDYYVAMPRDAILLRKDVEGVSH